MPVRQHPILIPRYLLKIKIFVYTKTCTWTIISTLFVKTKLELGKMSLIWGWMDQHGNNPHGALLHAEEQTAMPAAHACVSDACCGLKRSQAQKAAYCWLMGHSGKGRTIGKGLVQDLGDISTTVGWHSGILGSMLEMFCVSVVVVTQPLHVSKFRHPRKWILLCKLHLKNCNKYFPGGSDA